jgi:hypothetical protein
MICLICIVLILAGVPLGYYYAGPAYIIAASLTILYLVYRRTCTSTRCKK